MLKDISTIKVQGANFTEVTPFEIFDPKDGKDKHGNDIFKTVKGALLYGRNGTGKSTIAKAIRKAKGEAQQSIKQVAFFDNNGNPVILSEEEKERIFVFDEDFVNEKVKLKEDHLDTIIMLGQAANLAERIELAEKDRDSARTIFETKETSLKEFQDRGNPKSPINWLEQIGNSLRGDDAWAGRDRKINGGRKNTPVNEDTYKKFVDLKPTKTRSDLINEFKDQMNALDVAKSGAARLNNKVPALPNSFNKYDDDSIIELLAKKIEKPDLSEREQYLLSLVELGKAEELSQKAVFFRNPGVKKCPYCFQSVSDEYRDDLVNSIEKVLSKIVADHQKALGNCVSEEVFIDLAEFSVLKSCEVCNGLIEKINSSIRENNNALRQKIENPYTPIESSCLNVALTIKQLNEALERLENERAEFNAKAVDETPIIKKLNEINSQIAHYDVANLVKKYDKQLAEFKNVEKECVEARGNYDAKRKVIEDLEAQRKNVKLALEIMNACLKYIFFADNRLRINYVDGEYRLYSHGKSVRPCDVSVGERNIIGLSYFFTSIMAGQEETDVYEKEYLIVIDDPVSSYDTENRIGILSFLKYKLGLFLEGNEFSKAIVMTHDLMTFYDIHKVFEEIVVCCKRKGYALKPKFNRLELTDATITPFRYNNRQEYTEILKLIFNYGEGNTTEHELVIGNLMRQALEAFATFQYKKSIVDISTDPDILALLPAPEYRPYYENLMYRLVLHGSSHREEQIKAMKDYEFFSLISGAEKQRTAKEVLCFIYLLNKQHVLHHLHEIRNAESTLDTWCAEVKLRGVRP